MSTCAIERRLGGVGELPWIDAVRLGRPGAAFPAATTPLMGLRCEYPAAKSLARSLSGRQSPGVRRERSGWAAARCCFGRFCRFVMFMGALQRSNVRHRPLAPGFLLAATA